MSAAVGAGWAREHLDPIPSDQAQLEAAEQFAVHQTLARYAHALDQQHSESLADVLTEDTTWKFLFGGENELGPITGRDAVLDLVRKSIGTTPPRQRHHLVNVVIRGVDTGTAHAHAYLLLTSATDAGPNVLATGSYTFRLARTSGVWRIAELFLDTDNTW